MKKFIYFLAALMALTVTSCKDDDTTFNVTEDLDRLPMPMFRRKGNTNIADETDLFASRLVTGYSNRIQLHWYGIEGAAGYELRYMISGNARSEEDDWHGDHVTYVTLPADQLSYVAKDLEYDGTSYIFSIRALHPDGKEEHHSKWYGMGDGRQWEDYLTISTGPRYAVPNVVDVRDKDYDGFTVLIAPKFEKGELTDQEVDTIRARFGLELGDEIPFTRLIVKYKSKKAITEEINQSISKADLDLGEDGVYRYKVTGLRRNSEYQVGIVNDNNTIAQAEVDRFYNPAGIRTKGDPGAPIIIEHKVASSIWIDPEATTVPDMATEQKWFDAERSYNACRLDTVISNFNYDEELAEGQEFLLEGGKTYYLRVGPVLSKGFVLRTNPDDIAAGKGRAKVYMGGLFRDGSGSCVGACNWQLGREKMSGELDTPIQIEKVIFDNIEFSVPQACTFGEAQQTGAGATANYFANMPNQSMAVEFKGFEMHNCVFQNAQRGFFRIQGNKKRYIEHLIMDNCVLLNCGYYSNNGIDYNLFHGEAQTPEENICNDLQVTNTTFVNCPMGSIAPTKNKVNGNGFKDNVQWNIRVENNTFINFDTRKGQPLLCIKEVPGGSTIAFKNNLIVLTRADGDKRKLDFQGIQIQNIHGTQKVTFDIRDNYSASSEEAYRVPDGIVTNKTYAFSAVKNAPGAWWKSNPEWFSGNTDEDLVIKVGTPALKATDIFSDPNPKYIANSDMDNDAKMHYTDPEKVWNALTYKTDATLLNHEIYTKGIGAPRWRTSDPQYYYIDFVGYVFDTPEVAPAE